MSKTAKEILKFEHNDANVSVSFAYGSDDGYYWEKTFYLIINGKPYIMFEIGSCSGWIPNNNSLKQVNFDYLKGRKKEVETWELEIGVGAFNKELFITLYDFMIVNKASEVNQNDSYDFDINEYEIHVVDDSEVEV